MDYSSLIDGVFEKYLVLVNKYKTNPDIVYTVESLGYLRHEILPMFKRGGNSLENFYNNINSFYQSDLRLALKQSKAHLALEQDIKGLQIKKKNWFLVTVGFDDAAIKGKEPEIMRKAHSKIVETKGLEISAYVFEKHRKDGEARLYIHHHIHYVIQTDYAKSKVIQFIYQKVKNFGVGSKNFIDVSTNGTLQTALKYVAGDKKIDKLECIELDKIWRQENNLENL